MAGNYIHKQRALSVTMLLFAMLIGLGRMSWAQDDDDATLLKFSPEAAGTFSKRCTACHTYGKGIKVGPDLKGVNERRKHDWLLSFIRSSSSVIKSGDPTATALFGQFKQQRMPDWIDLSEKQINDILQYISIGGPDIKPADERDAELATAQDVELGRRFFYGEARLRYGAQACITCHAVAGAGLRGGSLGPDLSHAYSAYRDQSLTAFLRHPCFQWQSGTADGHYLSPKESFVLKAFLYQVSIHQNSASANAKSEVMQAGSASAKPSQASVATAPPAKRRE